MKNKENKKRPSLIERLRIVSPKLNGERPGAYDRRLKAEFNAEKRVEFQRKKAMELKENEAPKSWGARMVEKFIGGPMEFIKQKVDAAIEFIKYERDHRDDGVEYFYLSNNKYKKTGQLFVETIDSRGIVVLMSVTVVKTLIAVLPLKGSKADKTVHAQTLITKCGVSTYVSILPATITALHLAATNYGNSNPGNEETMWLNLNNGLKAMMAVFQAYGNANPLNASDCFTLAGFDIKKMTPRGKQPWSAKNNVVAGVIDLTATGGPGRSCHEWWISYNGSTFVRLEPTMQASTQVSGLASGTTVYFMHQLITKDGPQGMDLVIKIPVD